MNTMDLAETRSWVVTDGNVLKEGDIVCRNIIFWWQKTATRYIDTDGRDEFSNEVKLNLILFKQMTIIIQW